MEPLHSRFFEDNLKPISEFQDSATIAEINHENNLLCLCRNCHWELDNIGLPNLKVVGTGNAPVEKSL